MTKINVTGIRREQRLNLTREGRERRLNLMYWRAWRRDQSERTRNTSGMKKRLNLSETNHKAM
jgi:hypothetical protein